MSKEVVNPCLLLADRFVTDITPGKPPQERKSVSKDSFSYSSLLVEVERVITMVKVSRRMDVHVYF